MASSFLLLLLLLILASSSVSVFVSASQPVVLRLSHSLSEAQFNSTHHLLWATSSRSSSRFRLRHHRHLSDHRRSQVSLPLAPGSDYTLSFTLGSDPPQQVSLYMDTGSDLVWFPCSPFECILCDGKPAPAPALLNTSSASSVSCQSASCSAAHSSRSSSDLCAIARCPLGSIETSDCASFSCPPFYYAYGDGSFIARLYRHSLSLPMSSPSLVLHNFTFGCAHTALGEPIGVAGFGRGVLSLPAQLSRLSPQLGNRFSYCLVSHSFDSDQVRRPSPLILGHYDSKQRKSSSTDQNGSGGDFIYTDMLNNPKHPYYYCIGLEGISIGRKYIPAPPSLRRVDRKGNGGVVVDSGTTFTMLPSSLYGSMVAEFDRILGRVHERATGIEEKTGLSPCYYLDYDNNRKVLGSNPNVPTLSLHFVGSNETTVILPRRNYFYEFIEGGSGRRRNVGCLMVMNAGDEAELGDGPAGTLGNYQQQGFEVVYDLEERRVGFARRHCASLWDSLNGASR